VWPGQVMSLLKDGVVVCMLALGMVVEKILVGLKERTCFDIIDEC
jgi:hypothetical protein